MKIRFMGREYHVPTVKGGPPHTITYDTHTVTVADEDGVMLWFKDDLPPGHALPLAQEIGNALATTGPRRERMLRRLQR